jgi:hypothetical protein
MAGKLPLARRLVVELMDKANPAQLTSLAREAGIPGFSVGSDPQGDWLNQPEQSAGSRYAVGRAEVQGLTVEIAIGLGAPLPNQ